MSTPTTNQIPPNQVPVPVPMAAVPQAVPMTSSIPGAIPGAIPVVPQPVAAGVAGAPAPVVPPTTVIPTTPIPIPPQYAFLAPPKPPKFPPPTTPRRTLYIHNLNERVKLDIMKRTLKVIFSQFGEVIDIILKKGVKKRGQAFVVMKDVESATKILNVLQGFALYNKIMVIHYARMDSDLLAKMEGRLDEHIRLRKEEKIRRMKEAKKQKEEELKQKNVAPVVYEEPNNILFIQNLPEDVTKEAVTSLFQQYPGFKEVRLVPGKRDLAFIEYETEQQGAIVKQSLNGYKMTENNLIKVSFAKK